MKIIFEINVMVQVLTIIYAYKQIRVNTEKIKAFVIAGFSFNNFLQHVDLLLFAYNTYLRTQSRLGICTQTPNICK